MEKHRALKNLPRGQLTRIARRCGIAVGSVAGWSQVPAERVPDVAEITGVPPHVLRPDLPQLFPHPAEGDAS